MIITIIINNSNTIAKIITITLIMNNTITIIIKTVLITIVIKR
jgi:hypothetical protein